MYEFFPESMELHGASFDSEKVVAEPSGNMPHHFHSLLVIYDY